MGIDLLYGYLAEKLEEVLRINHEMVDRVAVAITEAHLAGHAIYGFGSGHSALLIEEMYYRAGGLNLIRPIWDFDVMIHHDPLSASERERTPGYAQKVLAKTHFNPGDMLWLVSNSGRNALLMEMAVAAKAQGVQVIALTSLNHSQAVEPHGPSHEKLYQVADFVLDNRGAIGDAGFWVTGVPAPMIPTSTILGAVLVHAVWMQVAEKLVAAGFVPEILRSFNLDHPIPDQMGSAG
ncbi:MAG: sugar isomerase domain-containing protein [Firmicutes bacterium]|nr:sugar isomerase domain-containing protein [Bacillota bacterium]